MPYNFVPPLKDIYLTTTIFMKTKPLGTEMNNVACSRLGNMLHLEIKKGKEAMKASDLQKYLGGAASCTKRPTMATKGCGQLTSNYT